MNLRSRDGGIAYKTSGMGASLFPAGGSSNADAAGGGRQSSVPASFEPKSQSAGAGENAAGWRDIARYCASAEGSIAPDRHATRQKRRRAVGVHLPRLTHQTTYRRIVSRFDPG